MRQLPAGELATLREPQPLPLVKLDRRVMRLAPGGRIYDKENRTIVHAQLPPNAPVLYTKDQNGDVQRIYILTPEEQARLSRPR